MLHRVKSRLSVECDSCADTFPAEEYRDEYTIDEFNRFVGALRRAGWGMRKTGKVWQHFCPDCNHGCNAREETT